MNTIGVVHSYERRPEFSTNAQKNFKAWHDRIDNVTFFEGDLAMATLEPSSYDAIYLDLMTPWDVLTNACKCKYTNKFEQEYRTAMQYTIIPKLITNR